MHYGEVTIHNVDIHRQAVAAYFLKETGFLTHTNELWVGTKKFLDLFPIENLTELMRKVFFSHPGYSRYLKAIAASEITRLGMEGAMNQVEGWIYNDLPHIAKDINAILDFMEKEVVKKPIKKCTMGELIVGFNEIIRDIQEDEGIDFEEWNKGLLGISGNQEGVFHAIIAKGAMVEQFSNITTTHRPQAKDRQDDFEASDTPWQDNPILSLNDELFRFQHRPVFMPKFPEDEKAELNPSKCQNIPKEHYVFGLIIPTLSITSGDASVIVHPPSPLSHPVPWLLVQLAIMESQGRMGNRKRLSLFMKKTEGGPCMEIYMDEVSCGPLVELLPSLLKILGFCPVMPFGKWTEEDIRPTYELLLNSDIFTVEEDRLCLSPFFKGRLYEHSLINILIRDPRVKRARARIWEGLEEILSKREQGGRE